MNLLASGEIISVVRKWKPYPAYKNSGVEWLGSIPEHWGTSAIRGLAKSGYKTFTDGDWIESPYIRDDGIRLIQTGNIGTGFYKEQGFRYIDESTFNSFRCTEILPGDVLICRLADPVGRACLAPNLGVRMITSVDVCILKVEPHVEPRFVVYALSGDQYLAWMDSICRGGTRDRVSRSMLASTRIPKPVFDEQRSIADFLDRETAKIDVLVAKKERLIALLQEKRAALITRAVTKGLDPHVRMKHSGVEWLGEIPAHWETKKLKHVVRVVSKGTTPTTVGSEFLDQGVRFIKAENIENGRIRDEPATFIDSATDELLRRSRLRSQDVLMVIAGATTGKVAIIDASRTPANTNQAVAFIRLKNPTVSRFLFYWLTGQKIQEQVWLKAVQAAQPNLSLGDIGNFTIAVPTAVEIELLEKYLDAECAKVDALIAKIREGIEKLKEHRTALISAAVTGKIDVREEVPKGS